MTSTGHLVMRYLADSDGTGRLAVEAVSEGFAGRSEAWFNTGDLIAFAESLLAYPLDPTKPPMLRSGHVGGGGLVDEHVGLVVRPIGSLGQIGVEVHLAQPWPPEPPRPRAAVTLELRATYQAIRELAADLASATADPEREARLDGEILAGSPRP